MSITPHDYKSNGKGYCVVPGCGGWNPNLRGPHIDGRGVVLTRSLAIVDLSASGVSKS